ncbi:MAG: hypothetical protein E7380_01585 [Clostridiales bacterium]|nr:hypothetical protein [Clostridiales bacterium]
MKTLGLALSAGGSRGVAHIGFLQALEEEGVAPSYIAGSSMGAVVGAAYAYGLTAAEIRKAVLGLHLRDLLSVKHRRGGLFGTDKMRNLLKRYLGEAYFSDLKIPFCAVAVDMCTQSIVECKEGSVLDAVVASATIPAVFHPLEKEGMRLIDGGILERVPVPQVKAMGADIVVAVDVLGQKACSKEKHPGTLSVVFDTFDILDNYKTRRKRKDNEKIIDFWLEPDLGDMNQYKLKRLQFAYDKGYEIGKANAPSIKKALR